MSEQLLISLVRVEPWCGLLAVGILFAYPNPLVPFALGALGVIGLARAARSQRLGWLTALDGGMVLLLVGSVLGLGVAHDREAAQLRLTGVVAAVAAFYLVLGQLRTEQALRRVTYVCLGLVALGIVAVLALLRGQLPDSAVARLISPVLTAFSIFPGVAGDTLDVNARFTVHQYGLAHLVLVAELFAVAAVALGGSKLAQSGGWAALLVLTPLLLATQARGAMVAFALSATLIAAQRTRWAWTILPVSAATFVGLLARGTISRSLELEWLTDRASYWTRTLAMLGDFPLTGSGLGARTFAEAFAWYHGLPDPYQVSHTHSIYLQAYVEQGLFGLVGLAVILGIGIGLGFRAVQRSLGSARWLVAGAFGGVVGSAIYGLTDQVPSTNFSLGLVFALLAIIVAACRGFAAGGPSSSEVARPAMGPRRGLDRRWAVGVGGISLLAGVALAPRWGSGLLLNVGTANLTPVLLSRSHDLEASRDRLALAHWALSSALRLNPANVAAQRNLGWTLLLQHDITGAHDVIRAAYRAHLNTFERAQLARLARDAGLIELAVALLKEGRDASNLRDLAAQQWNARRWREAALAYAALTELDPDEAEYVSNTALAVLNGGGDASAAIDLLREAVARNPDSARSLARQLTLRGEPYRNDEKRGGGRLDLAVFWFGLASLVDPTYDRPEVELGSAYFYRERYDDAARHFLEASRRDPRNASTYIQLGDTYSRLGRLDEAIGFYERAVQTRPERAELRISLARAYVAAGRRADALQALRTAAAIAPNNATIRDELGRMEAEN